MSFAYLKFFTADWLEDTATLSFHGQGLWMRVICRLSKSSTPGEATYTQSVWSRILGIPSAEFQSFVQELIEGDVGQVVENEDGTWTLRSNRMVEDWKEYDQLSEKRRQAGQAGGKARAKANTKQNEASACDLLEQNTKQTPKQNQAIPEARSQKPEAISLSEEREGNHDDSIPTLEDVLTEASMRGIPEEHARSFFDYTDNKNLWLNQYGTMTKWRGSLKSWSERRRTIKNNGGSQNTNTINRNAGTANDGLANDYEAFAQQQHQEANA